MRRLQKLGWNATIAEKSHRHFWHGNQGEADRERSEDIQARLTRAAELGRLERERAEVEKSILVLSTDIAAARRERDRDAAQSRDGKEGSAPAVERKLSADQWRDQVRRQRVDAKEKTQDRDRTRDRTKDKDRDGPDYER